MMINSPELIVTTMLGGGGPTGVETHCHGVMRHAAALGCRTRLVTPYTGRRWLRAFFRPLKNRRSEMCRVLYRRAQAWLIEIQLAALKAGPSTPSTLYAQCPITAQAGLRAAKGEGGRLVLAVHYNRAESDEVVEKGIARPGGPWCRELDRVEQWALPRVSRIVFVSEYMRRIVNERLPQIAEVPQSTLMNFSAAPPVVDGGPIAGDLITIGTLEPRKNQSFLFRALARARERGERFSLALAGDGPDRKKLEQLRDDLGLQGQVKFLGFQPQAARLIPRYRALAHAALVENCPITLIEGLACGRPLLAPKVGGIPEIFRDGIEGFFWNLEDPSQGADRLIALLGNQRTHATMSAAAKQRYDQVFVPLPEQWVTLLMAPEPGRTA